MKKPVTRTPSVYWLVTPPSTPRYADFNCHKHFDRVKLDGWHVCVNKTTSTSQPVSTTWPRHASAITSHFIFTTFSWKETISSVERNLHAFTLVFFFNLCMKSQEQDDNPWNNNPLLLVHNI